MTEEKELSNEHLKVKLSELPNCLVKFELTVDSQATQAAFLKAIKNVSKEVNVRGFRKGKAPETIVIQRFRKQIEEEFRSIVVNSAIHEAFQLTQRFPYNEKAMVNVHVDNCSRLEGAKITVAYEAYPAVPSIDPTILQITKIEATPVTEKEIANELNQLLYRFAEWTEVTDRPVQEGDYIDLDVVAVQEQGEKSICADTRFLVKEGRMGEWMRTLVLGMHLGESAEGMSEKENTHQEENEGSDSFVPSLCRLTLKGIKTAKLPEITDDFSTNFGVKTELELRENIEQLIAKRKQRDAQERAQGLVERALLEKYPFDLPSSLMRSECASRVENAVQHLEQKLSKQEIAERKHQLEAEISTHVARVLSLEFLIYKLIREKEIEVTSEEVYKEYFNQMMLQPQERLFDLDKDKEKMPAILKRIIVFKKALDYILSHANS